MIIPIILKSIWTLIIALPLPFFTVLGLLVSMAFFKPTRIFVIVGSVLYFL